MRIAAMAKAWLDAIYRGCKKEDFLGNTVPRITLKKISKSDNDSNNVIIVISGFTSEESDPNESWLGLQQYLKK